MAKSNQEGASGEENNKGQAHDCAVCYGHMMYVVIERNKGGGEGFRVLSVCSGSCRLVSVVHFTTRKKAILRAITAARAESLILSRDRASYPAVKWRKCDLKELGGLSDSYLMAHQVV